MTAATVKGPRGPREVKAWAGMLRKGLEMRRHGSLERLMGLVGFELRYSGLVEELANLPAAKRAAEFDRRWIAFSALLREEILEEAAGAETTAQKAKRLSGRTLDLRRVAAAAEFKGATRKVRAILAGAKRRPARRRKARERRAG